MKTLLYFSLLAFLISGCSPKINQVSKPDASLTETYWKLTELLGKPVPPVAADAREKHLIFKKEGSRVQGFAGCNTFNGGFSMKEPNRLLFTGMASTLMACIDMQQESDFLQIFEQADSYYIKGDTLQLIRARMAPLAKFQAVYFK